MQDNITSFIETRGNAFSAQKKNVLVSYHLAINSFITQRNDELIYYDSDLNWNLFSPCPRYLISKLRHYRHALCLIEFFIIPLLTGPVSGANILTNFYPNRNTIFYLKVLLNSSHHKTNVNISTPRTSISVRPQTMENTLDDEEIDKRVGFSVDVLSGMRRRVENY